MLGAMLRHPFNERVDMTTKILYAEDTVDLNRAVSVVLEHEGFQVTACHDGVEAESALATMNMQMEAFVEAARDADVLIYNSSIDGELFTLEDLFAKSALLKDFQAVRTGEVYCTGKNMFQETSAFADMIREMHLIFTGEAAGAELQYFHRLQ